MVGHTGDLSATIKSVESIDLAVKKIMDAVLEVNGTLIITADHGNAELKINTLSGEINTEHTINPVPLYLVTNQLKKKNIRENKELREEKTGVKGILQDVAATVLDLMQINAPSDMDGKSLLPILYK